jgi:hypothetical protein
MSTSTIYRSGSRHEAKVRPDDYKGSRRRPSDGNVAAWLLLISIFVMGAGFGSVATAGVVL